MIQAVIIYPAKERAAATGCKLPEGQKYDRDGHNIGLILDTYHLCFALGGLRMVLLSQDRGPVIHYR
jgi:hypothetical protein